MEPLTLPVTPPRRRNANPSQLLTPPPSAGFAKKIDVSTHEEPGLAVEVVTQEPFLEGCESLGASSPATSTSDSFNGYHVDSVASVEPCEVERTLDFLSLPLTARRAIYILLLTVPGLICVRQNRTAGSYETNAYIGPENRELLPGISFALVQTSVDGMKSRFGNHPYVNVSILRTCKAVFHEARTVMYTANTLELANLTHETAPPANFRVPLFPRGYPRYIRHIVLRAMSFYAFRYLLADEGCMQIKGHYRGLKDLTLIIELNHMNQRIVRKLGLSDAQDPSAEVKRAHAFLRREFFGNMETTKTLPHWVKLKILLTGDEFFANEGHGTDESGMRHVNMIMTQAFEMFKSRQVRSE